MKNKAIEEIKCIIPKCWTQIIGQAEIGEELELVQL